MTIIMNNLLGKCGIQSRPLGTNFDLGIPEKKKGKEQKGGDNDDPKPYNIGNNPSGLRAWPGLLRTMQRIMIIASMDLSRPPRGIFV